MYYEFLSNLSVKNFNKSLCVNSFTALKQPFFAHLKNKSCPLRKSQGLKNNLQN